MKNTRLSAAHLTLCLPHVTGKALYANIIVLYVLKIINVAIRVHYVTTAVQCYMQSNAGYA